MSTPVVSKVWGLEWVSYQRPECAVTVLHIARKRMTSLHCHPNKATVLVCISGILKVSIGTQEADGKLTERVLGPLGCVSILKGVYHRTEAVGELDLYPPSEDGCWLIEIEEPSNKLDLIRAKDAYGRAGQPYESESVPYKGEILKLSEKPSRFMGYTFRVCDADTRADLCLPLGTKFLTIRKDNTVKVSDYIADFIANLGIKHVFGVVGGGSMHLNDSFGHHDKLKFIACHHEQAAAMAADSYARLNGIAACLFTTGPGGTNGITGVACSWIDSIAMVVISGQVTTDTLLSRTGVRQFGVQEVDIVSLVRPITKYAVTVKDAADIRYELERAAVIAQTGRPGPVWIDVCLDIQSKRVDPVTLRGIDSLFGTVEGYAYGVETCLTMLQEAKRPVLIAGHGIRLAGACEQFRRLVDVLGIPVVTSWGAADMLASDHPYHIGHCGIFGDRASNFTVQNADLLLVIGCRLSIPQMGYNAATFARQAKIIMVDIDAAEFKKPSLKVTLGIRSDAKAFLSELDRVLLRGDDDSRPEGAYAQYIQRDWINRCQEWKAKYPVVTDDQRNATGAINSYAFVEALSKRLPDDAVVVVDTGTSFTCVYQAAKMKLGQRWINDCGHAAMGFALPAAVGAAFATGRKVICITGDGGLQFNIQELATIAHHKLPIVIFVLSNGGYLTMRHTWQNHFGRLTGCGLDSGLSFPDLEELAPAYGISYWLATTREQLLGLLDNALAFGGPLIFEINMPHDQALIPRNSSLIRPDGSIVSKPLEDLFPFLPRDEFNAQMIIPTVDVLG